VIVIVGVALLFAIVAGAESREQPINFWHVTHAEQGIDCVYCHSGATRSPVAGIPSVEKCMGCHAYVDTGSEELGMLREYWESGEPIPWERVSYLPRYVRFPHYVHIDAGVNCENCHGDVGSMEAVDAERRFTMGWCLRCHQREPEPAELMDCALCHY
jgi:hypothetical protein